MKRSLFGWAASAALVLSAGTAGAAVVSNFEDGTANGWQNTSPADPSLTMIIAEESAGRLVSNEYRGPSISVTETPGFKTWDANEVLQWLLFGELPADTLAGDRMSVLKRLGNR